MCTGIWSTSDRIRYSKNNNLIANMILNDWCQYMSIIPLYLVMQWGWCWAYLVYFCTFFRVRLSKRRVKDAPTSNSLLVVKHRELFDQESAMQVSFFNLYAYEGNGDDVELVWLTGTCPQNPYTAKIIRSILNYSIYQYVLVWMFPWIWNIRTMFQIHRKSWTWISKYSI